MSRISDLDAVISEHSPPQVTVLMPVCNGEPFLAYQMDSILGQTGVDVRVIAIDDCSTDRSPETLSAYARADSRLTVHTHASNEGLLRTVRELMGMVQTEYWALSDQDDVWDRDKLILSVRQLVEARASMVYSDVRVINEVGEILHDSYFDSRRIRVYQGTDPAVFIFRNPAIGHTIVARAAVTANAKLMPESLVFHEPWIAAAACLGAGVTCVPQPLGGYRQHGGNLVGAKRASALVRAKSLLSTAGRLEKRERTRAEAAAAVALLHPDVRPVADVMARGGIWDVASVVVPYLWSHRREIGTGPVLIESALIILCRALGRPLAATVAPQAVQRGG